MGLRLSSDLKLRSGGHQIHLHGADSDLTMDFNSLGSLRHLQRQLPRPLTVGGTAKADPVVIVIRVRGIHVATVNMKNGRFTIRKHWFGIVRSFFR